MPYLSYKSHLRWLEWILAWYYYIDFKDPTIVKCCHRFEIPNPISDITLEDLYCYPVLICQLKIMDVILFCCSVNIICSI